MKKGTRREAGAEQAILDAAEELFLEKGYALTSTVEIAKKAGCNQALVHYYFRSKEKLFNTVFIKKVSLLLSSFIEINRENASFEERLKQEIELHFDLFMSNPKLPFLLINELTTNPSRLLAIKKRLKKLPQKMLGLMQAELDAEAKKGTVRPMTVVDLILLIVSVNVVPFLARPILAMAIGMDDAEFIKLVERKKQENVQTVLRAIRP